MADSDDTLLDLSGWPAPPPAAPPAPVLPVRPGLPRRPAGGSRLGSRRPTARACALVAIAAGGLLLVVPTPGCGPSAAALLRSTSPLPSSPPPALDDHQVAADADAVRAAQSALGAWRPETPAPQPTPSARTRTVTVSSVSSREVAAAEQELEAAQHQVSRAQAELDRLLAAQEESSDPASYDGQVAAAQEELDQAVAQRDGARQALATARSRTTDLVVRSTPSARPAATPSPAGDRAALVAAVDDARRLQAAHLAARQEAVAGWRARLAADTARVTRHNAQVRSCAERAGVPVSAGLGLLALGLGLLGWRRLAARP